MPFGVIAMQHAPMPTTLMGLNAAVLLWRGFYPQCSGGHAARREPILPLCATLAIMLADGWPAHSGGSVRGYHQFLTSLAA